ncbi:MAG TPA: hypothetical protein VHB77_15070 [Planctomycetaceae bacterium]|nr:hypothetical protein [Planctomycetaceae bacterium]
MRVFLILAVVLAVAGCGGRRRSPGEPDVSASDLTPVSGVVKLDGEPLREAAVSFVYSGESRKDFVGSGGQTDFSGKYQLRSGSKIGTLPGRYRVTISRLASKDGSPVKADPENGMDMEQMRMTGQLVDSVPPRYSDPEKTELSVEIVKNQKDPIDFDLKSN